MSLSLQDEHADTAPFFVRYNAGLWAGIESRPPSSAGRARCAAQRTSRVRIDGAGQQSTDRSEEKQFLNAEHGAWAGSAENLSVVRSTRLLRA